MLKENENDLCDLNANSITTSYAQNNFVNSCSRFLLGGGVQGDAHAAEISDGTGRARVRHLERGGKEVETGQKGERAWKDLRAAELLLLLSKKNIPRKKIEFASKILIKTKIDSTHRPMW